MEKIVAELLKKKVDEVIKNFSNVHRKHNTNSESYSLDRIVALGESSACALFNKSSGKKALAFFFYVKGMNYWSYFFVSYVILLGLRRCVCCCKRLRSIILGLILFLLG